MKRGFGPYSTIREKGVGKGSMAWRRRLLGTLAPYARYPLENTSQSPQQICQISIYIPTVQSRFCQVVGTRCSTYSTSVDNRHNARLFTSYATFEGLTVSPWFSLQPPFDALPC